MSRNKPEWVRSTPRENYAKGVSDAAFYMTIGRDVVLPWQELRTNHGWAAGIVAFNYGVNLQPPGKD